MYRGRRNECNAIIQVTGATYLEQTIEGISREY